VITVRFQRLWVVSGTVRVRGNVRRKRRNIVTEKEVLAMLDKEIYTRISMLAQAMSAPKWKLRQLLQEMQSRGLTESTLVRVKVGGAERAWRLT